MRRMDASFKKARALRLRFSQSLARRRQRLSHAIVRSTIQRLGNLAVLHDRCARSFHLRGESNIKPHFRPGAESSRLRVWLYPRTVENSGGARAWSTRDLSSELLNENPANGALASSDLAQNLYDQVGTEH